MERACSQCALPLGRYARAAVVGGETCWFCCYGCSLAWQVRHGERFEPEAAALLIRLGLGGFLAMNVMLASLLMYAGAFDTTATDDAWVKSAVHWLSWLLATPLVVLLGKPFAAGAVGALRAGRVGTDALVCIGVLAAYSYSAVQVLRGSDLVYFDTASMVLLLFTLGRYLEALARARSARDVAPMLAAERAEVRLVRDDGEARCPVSAVRPGDLLRVLPGERVAVDGVVVAGRSACDEAIVTGQPAPRGKTPGSDVIAGSLNGTGVLLVRATVDGGATRWIHVSRLVREALARKSIAGEMVDRFVAWFIPGVLLLAAGTAWAWFDRAGADAALLAGIAVLVVACPCSLGLAAPVASALAIGQAARRAVLLRGGAVLERLARLRGVAFDKTGTLTRGDLDVVDVATDRTPAFEVMLRAAAIARYSDHPVSRAIVALAAASPATAREQAAVVRADDIVLVPGRGLRATLDGQPHALGSAAWMRTLGLELPATLAAPSAGATVTCIGWAGRVHGRFAFVDRPVGDAAAVVAALRERGLALRLLSGDGTAAVAPLADALQLDAWDADLLPEDKVRLLDAWTGAIGPVAMVGDGLNDGPVLAAASVGIAVGGATDLARESADVVLPRDGLAALPWLIGLARRTRASVRANLAWAFSYNAIALTLAATGLLRPVLAAALMAGSSLLIVARSWRASERARADEARTPGLDVPPGRDPEPGAAPALLQEMQR
jgi:Cu2+-exporting ATPase